jgi:outer membrane protein, heavy metal efflux system
MFTLHRLHRGPIPTAATAVLLASAWAQPAPADPGEAALAREARLEVILPIALRSNPDLAERRARVAAARSLARLAGRLPETQLKYEQWGTPLARPLALPDSNAVMLGLSQTFPAPGTRAARARAADQAAVSTAASEETRRLDLIAEVRRAVAEYFRADREVALHREHVDLTARLVELARVSYRAGKRSQQDVLRLSLELHRLHRDLAHVEQERVSARASLNTLMNRPLDAPLGPPAELAPVPALAAGDDRALAPGRAELVAARAALDRSEAELDLARREGRWPALTIGADYMYMPAMPERHGYGLMLMVNLPWLSGARRDAVAAAEQGLVADRHALQSVRNALAYRARDARARFDAARATLEIIDKDLLPFAQRNLETAQAGYGTGQGDASVLVDALRSYLDTRLDRVKSLVHLEETAADLARALAGREGSP